MDKILGGEPRLQEVSDWKRIFGEVIEEVNKKTIQQDTQNLSQEQIIEYCMITRHFHKRDLVELLSVQEDIVRKFEEGPHKSWIKNLYKKHDEVAARKLILKHSDLIKKMIDNREGKQTIIEAV